MTQVLSPFVDGQTRGFYLAESPQLHPAVSGEFRPMTFEQIEQVEMLLDKHKNEFAKRAAAVIGAIARQLVSWDIDAGTTVDVVKRLHPRLINKLYLIVVGRDGGDLPPSATADELEEFSRELISGNPGNDREESTVKNS
jgi:hypothetical protein